MKNLFCALLLLLATDVFSQSKDETAIRALLNRQTADWNNGKIESFMEGYWKNDSLTFIGKSGVTHGWNNTLANYKKGYPDIAAMGQLSFTILKVKRLSGKFYWLVGKWFLKRTIGDVGGYFDLLFEKVNGLWVIIADHSS
jgi:hypothetical protein